MTNDQWNMAAYLHPGNMASMQDSASADRLTHYEEDVKELLKQVSLILD